MIDVLLLMLFPKFNSKQTASNCSGNRHTAYPTFRKWLSPTRDSVFANYSLLHKSKWNPCMSRYVITLDWILMILRINIEVIVYFHTSLTSFWRKILVDVRHDISNFWERSRMLGVNFHQKKDWWHSCIVLLRVFRKVLSNLYLLYI